MSSLDEPTKTRVEVAITSSKFGTVKNFREEFAKAQKVLKEIEATSEIDEGVESELANRFRLISVESKDSTATVSDAAVPILPTPTSLFLSDTRGSETRA